MSTKQLDYSQIKADLESFGRLLPLKWPFRESENFSEYPAFRPSHHPGTGSTPRMGFEFDKHKIHLVYGAEINAKEYI